jgi:hypothetical protein
MGSAGRVLLVRQRGLLSVFSARCHHRRMVAGYGGVYRARVLDDVDPVGQRLLQVQVPEVFGDPTPVWAVPGEDVPTASNCWR